MSLDIHTLEGLAIQQLIPINQLSDAGFKQFSSIVTVVEVPQEYKLFEIDETENDFIFLLSGEIILRSDNMIVEKITANTDATKFPLAHQVPRKINAIVSSSTARFIRFSVDFFNSLEKSVTGNIDATEDGQQGEQNLMDTEMEEQDDWMENLLSSPIFQLLPPANLQKILIALEEVSFKKGEQIIKQGDVGDYFYLIRKGNCLVSRKPSPSSKEIKLAKLHPKDTFGEDALISEEPRSVSITAMAHVVLQRLDKERFLKLMKEPVLSFLDFTELSKALAKGASLLDVRPEDEYTKNNLEGSINIPSFSLRMQLKSLDRTHKIVVVCANGKSSEASCFFLLKNGFDSIILKGGMKNLPKEAVYDIGDSLVLEQPHLVTDVSQKTNKKEIAPTNANGLKAENATLKQDNQELQQKNIHLEEQLKMLEAQINQLEEVLTNMKGILL